MRKKNIMKSGTQNQIEGKFHKAKGTIKENTGKITMNHSLTDAGKHEKISGKIQEKIGQVKKIFGK